MSRPIADERIPCRPRIRLDLSAVGLTGKPQWAAHLRRDARQRKRPKRGSAPPSAAAYRCIVAPIPDGTHAPGRRAVPDQAHRATAALGYRPLNRYRLVQPDWVECVIWRASAFREANFLMAESDYLDRSCCMKEECCTAGARKTNDRHLADNRQRIYRTPRSDETCAGALCGSDLARLLRTSPELAIRPRSGGFGFARTPTTGLAHRRRRPFARTQEAFQQRR